MLHCHKYHEMTASPAEECSLCFRHALSFACAECSVNVCGSCARQYRDVGFALFLRQGFGGHALLEEYSKYPSDADVPIRSLVQAPLFVEKKRFEFMRPQQQKMQSAVERNKALKEDLKQEIRLTKLLEKSFSDTIKEKERLQTMLYLESRRTEALQRQLTHAALTRKAKEHEHRLLNAIASMDAREAGEATAAWRAAVLQAEAAEKNTFC